MRPLARAIALSLLATAPSTALAARVRDLAVTHHDGQTFVSWTCPAGPGWLYRVYACDHQIYYLSDFWTASLIGTAGDSSACDRRLSTLLGTPQGYRVDSTDVPLDPGKGLYVVTVRNPGQRFFCVTAESAGLGEQRSFQLGANTLLVAVDETPGRPRPIYQRNVTYGGYEAEVYTLWTDDALDRPEFPAMTNRKGMAFDCAVVRGGPGPSDPMLLRLHQRGGNFLQALGGSGWPGEWRLTLDEPWMNWDGNSFWYGWHENYDVENPFNTPPTSGMIRDYSMQRVLYTLEWALANFPIDRTRVYAQGYSMGGIGGMFVAFRRPDLIAAVQAVVAKFDFSFQDDLNPECLFNPGGPLRDVANKMWGPVSANLPTSDGPGVYEQLNDGYLAKANRAIGVPPILSFNGRRDYIVGWGEKIEFYKAMNKYRQGGYYFWDQREHSGEGCTWDPMQDAKYLYRFRTDRSFPALTNCSANSNPGFGDMATGDSVGTINGFVEWDTTIVDEPDCWEVRLTLRDLQTRWGVRPAPESLMVDATPRRVQRFPIEPLGLYRWTLTRLADGAVVKSGIEQADTTGLLTFWWLKVYRVGGSRLRVERVWDTADAPGAGAEHGLALAIGRNPVSSPTSLAIRWPRAGDAKVELLDVSGRLVRTLWSGRADAGTLDLRLDPRDLSSGVYFVSARQGELAATRRVVVVR